MFISGFRAALHSNNDGNKISGLLVGFQSDILYLVYDVQKSVIIVPPANYNLALSVLVDIHHPQEAERSAIHKPENLCKEQVHCNVSPPQHVPNKLKYVSIDRWVVNSCFDDVSNLVISDDCYSDRSNRFQSP